MVKMKSDKKLKDELNALLQNAEGLINTSHSIESSKPITNKRKPNLSSLESFDVNEQAKLLLNSQSNTVNDTLQTNQVSKYKRIDIDEIDSRFKIQAKSVITSMYNFYLDFGVIDRPEYLERKSSIDSLDLSNIFLQLKMTKSVMGKVMDEIMSGNVEPRLIEAYATINSQFSESIKSLANYMLFLEESIKKSKYESIDYSNNKKNKSISQTSDVKTDAEIIKSIDDDCEYFVTSDPMVLMTEITEKNEMLYDDVKTKRRDYLIERGDVGNLVDPQNKNDILKNYNVDPSTIKVDEITDDYDNILDMI
jgi:hypothetical protein